MLMPYVALKVWKTSCLTSQHDIMQVEATCHSNQNDMRQYEMRVSPLFGSMVKMTDVGQASRVPHSCL